jgi:hypothetical protein
MPTSSPSPGGASVVVPNNDVVPGSLPSVNQEHLGVPGGVPVAIPDPNSRFLGGLNRKNPSADLVVGGLSFSVINHQVVLGGLPVVNHNPGVVPGGLPIGLIPSPVVPGGTPFVVPSEDRGHVPQFLGENDIVISGLSPRVASPGGVPVVIR